MALAGVRPQATSRDGRTVSKRLAHLASIDNVGKALFGTPRRLRFGLWVATLPGTRERTFTVKEYKEWLVEKELSGFNNVGVDIKRFIEMEMLVQVQPAERQSTRTKFYKRTTSPLWDVFLIAAVVLQEDWEGQQERARLCLQDLMELRDELLHGMERERGLPDK